MTTSQASRQSFGETLQQGSSTPKNSKAPVTLQPATALYDFRSSDISKLSFRAGDTIHMISKHPSGWANGMMFDTATRDARTGWFPASYVQVIAVPEEPVPVPPTTAASSLETKPSIDLSKPRLSVDRTDVISPVSFFAVYADQQSPEPVSPTPEDPIVSADQAQNKNLTNPVKTVNQSTPQRIQVKSRLKTTVAKNLPAIRTVQAESVKPLAESNGNSKVSPPSKADSPRSTISPTAHSASDDAIPSFSAICFRAGVDAETFESVTRPQRLFSWDDLIRGVVTVVSSLNECLEVDQSHKMLDELAREVVTATGKLIGASGLLNRNSAAGRQLRGERDLLTMYRDLLTALKDLVDGLCSTDSGSSNENRRRYAGLLLLSVRNLVARMMVKVPASVPVSPADKTERKVAEQTEKAIDASMLRLRESVVRELQIFAVQIKTSLDDLSAAVMSGSEMDNRRRILVDKTKPVITLVTRLVALIEKDQEHDSNLPIQSVDIAKQKESAMLVRTSMADLVQAVTEASLNGSDGHLSRQVVLQCSAVYDVIQTLISTAEIILPKRRASLPKALTEKPTSRSAPCSPIVEVAPSADEHGFEEIQEIRTLERNRNQQKQRKLRKFFGEAVASRESLTSEKVAKFFGEKPTPSVSMPSSPLGNKSNFPSWMGYDYKDGDLIFHSDDSKKVKAGTVDALVERLTSHSGFDTEFTREFLYTFKSFLSPEELVVALERRLAIQPPADLKPSDKVSWMEFKHRPIVLRVYKTLKKWLEEFWYEPVDGNSIELIRNLARSHLAISMPREAEKIAELCSRRQQHGRDDATFLSNGSSKFSISSLPGFSPITPKIKMPTPLLPKSNTDSMFVRFMEMEPLEAARQLTIIESRLFAAVHPMDFLFYQPQTTSNSANRRNKAVPSGTDEAIRKMIHHSNQVTSWIAETILKEPEAKERARFIKHFVKIAEKCHTLNNFATREAILAGLNSTAIYRLKQTWEHVSPKTKANFETLILFLDRDNHFQAYRQSLKAVSPPCIPFLGLYLSDITFISQGNPEHLAEGRLINFDKYARMAAIVEEIRRLQSYLHQFVPLDDILGFIEKQLSESRDIQELHEVSLQVEPRVQSLRPVADEAESSPQK